jgi:glycosyltransferase involved in cell wall biosynthesis
MKPLVSILIPAYNAQDWLAYTLRSALAQTWERKEIIVIDDGSKDETLAVARRFESPTVRVISQENMGAAGARNKAFSLSQGDFIQWLDADDLLAPEKIRYQMDAWEKCREEGVLLSSAWGHFLSRYNHAKFLPSGLWTDLDPIEWLVRKMEQNVYMQTATWLVSRSLTEAAGPWDTRLLGDDDGEYFSRVLLQSKRVKFVPESKVYYRRAGAGSLSYVGRSNRKRDAQWLSMKLHVSYIRSRDDSERVRRACTKYLQDWLVSFYRERPDIVMEASELAKSLGGELAMPRLSWKYAWIETLWGAAAATRAQVLLPSMKWSLVSQIDKALFRIEESFGAAGMPV